MTDGEVSVLRGLVERQRRHPPASHHVSHHSLLRLCYPDPLSDLSALHVSLL